MNPLTTPSALSTSADVVAFANTLSTVADKLHETLRRLTSQSEGDTTIAYALLTEEYALRARINILHNDATRHTLEGIGFSQVALLNTLNATAEKLGASLSLEAVQSIVSDLITFASAICPGKATVVNFLAAELGVEG